MTQERRSFEFLGSADMMACTLESDRDARTMKIKFVCSNVYESQELPIADKRQIADAESLIKSIQIPFSGVLSRVMNFGKEPLVKFSRPYLEDGKPVLVADITVDKAADFKTVLREVVETLVSHKMNKDKAYHYRGKQYGVMNVPVSEDSGNGYRSNSFRIGEFVGALCAELSTADPQKKHDVCRDINMVLGLSDFERLAWEDIGHPPAVKEKLLHALGSAYPGSPDMLRDFIKDIDIYRQESSNCRSQFDEDDIYRYELLESDIILKHARESLAHKWNEEDVRIAETSRRESETAEEHRARVERLYRFKYREEKVNNDADPFERSPASEAARQMMRTMFHGRSDSAALEDQASTVKTRSLVLDEDLQTEKLIAAAGGNSWIDKDLRRSDQFYTGRR